MTTVSPNGLKIIEPRADRRRNRGRASARVADLAAMRGIAVSFDLILFMAVVAALVGAVLPS